MSTFLTIPYEEIKKFLQYYHLKISRDSKANYLTVWNYILDNPDLYLPSEHLKDFVLAYNLQGEMIEKHSTFSILSRSDEELGGLAHSLGFPQVNKERIIRILGYLDLLDNDMTLFDNLPKEVLKFMASKLDCQSLGLFCQIVPRFNQLFCATGELTEMLRYKLQEITGFDLSAYDKKALGVVCQINTRKSRLSAGASHSLVLDTQGHVYSFGTNQYGQLGTGDQERKLSPTLIDIDDVIAISAGGQHSLLLNSQGQVYSFGDGTWGQLGLKGMEHLTPNMIEDIEEIVAIAAGGAHSLLLNSRGQVYSFGNNNYGQLGLGDQNHRRVPILLDDSRIGRVTAIEAGTYYSLLLNDQGQVFSFGSGSSGKLGHGDNNDRNVPTLIFPSQGQIMSISAGGGHSFLLDARGRYYGFGSSSMGQLGNGVYERDLRRGLTLIHPDRNVPTWTPVPKLFKVVAISAGYSHTLFLNSQGQAFSCGYGFMGRLGLGDNKDQSQPVLLESPELGTIIDVAAGSAHSLILNSQGQIFSFGHGGFGQLGLGKTENRNVPTLIEDFSI